MPGLTAGGTGAGWAQTLRLGLGEAIGGRRLAAVVGVRRRRRLERVDLVAQGLAFLPQRGVLGPQRGDLRLDPVQLQQHAHDGVFAGAVEGLRLLARHGVHNARWTLSTSG